MANTKSRSSNQNQQQKLLQENIDLKAEIKKLKQEQNKKNTPFNWRRLFKWASIVVAGAIFVVASFTFYIGMTLTNTDRFMGVASPLIRQPAVQDAIATRTTNALFEQVNTQQLAQEVLPDKVDFLAPTVASQIETFATKETKNILANQTFQQTWDSSVRSAHERFITTLKNYEGDGTLDINDMYSRLSERLEGGKLDFLAGKELPPRIGSITLIQADWLPLAHSVVSNFQTMRIITILLFFLLIGLAIYLAANRRKTIMQIGWLIAILSIIMLITLRILRNISLNELNPMNQDAALQVWSVFTRPFAIQLILTLLIGLALVAVAWIGGQSRAANRIRNKVELLFAGKFHESIFSKENNLTLWAGKHREALLTIVGAGFILSLLFIEVSVGSFVTALIVTIIIALIIETISGQEK